MRVRPVLVSILRSNVVHMAALVAAVVLMPPLAVDAAVAISSSGFEGFPVHVIPILAMLGALFTVYLWQLRRILESTAGIARKNIILFTMIYVMLTLVSIYTAVKAGTNPDYSIGVYAGFYAMILLYEAWC